jgi:hypothetical protein
LDDPKLEDLKEDSAAKDALRELTCLLKNQKIRRSGQTKMKIEVEDY